MTEKALERKTRGIKIMSDRFKVNGVQIFGNNEMYDEMIDFLTSKGIQMDKDGRFEGEIDDFMGLLETIETIVMKVADSRQKCIDKAKRESEKHPDDIDLRDRICTPTAAHYIPSIFDMQYIYYEMKLDEKEPNEALRISLFDRLVAFINTSYAFMPYEVYLACADDLKVAEPIPGHLCNYELMPGKKINVSFR